MEKLKQGDVVQLNSGGPKMSVVRFIGADTSNFQLTTVDEVLKMGGFTDGDVVCQWFNANDLATGTFKIETLKIVHE